MMETISDSPSPRRWRRYPKYKPSGVKWLGEVPEGWKNTRLKYLTMEPLKYGLNEATTSCDKNFPRYVRITDINSNGTLKDDTFLSLPENIAKEFVLHTGDILFARSGATVGKSFIYDKSWGRCCYAGYLVRFRYDKKKILPYFIYYFTNSRNYWDWISSVNIQSTIQNVSGDKYANLEIPLPPLPEQHAIAAFLDRETARIDALIEKKERQIELLQEKRSALISHAVTKGLDPNAKMKDSGIEWLGMVPEGWEIIKFKRCISIKEGQIDPERERYRKLILIAPNHIESFSGKILFTETAEEQGAESGKYLFDEKDVLYSKIRPHLVKSCFPGFNGLCSADIYPLRPKNNIVGKFLLYVLISKYFTDFSIQESMRVAMPKINRESLSDCSIVLPAIDEQLKICEILDNKIETIHTVTQKIKNSIEKLYEYRSALISASVIGKIDVRQEVEA